VNHAQFHQAVAAIANGRYFTTQVVATTFSPGKIRIRWQAYIDGKDWTQLHITPQGALDELVGVLPETKLEDIGTSPKASPAAFEPVAPPASYAEEDAAPVF
jgi:hypothetical protein